MRQEYSKMKIGYALSQYLDHLKDLGKSKMTLYTYGKDAEQINAFFGDKDLQELTKPWIGRFLKSDELNKLNNGKNRAPMTVNKTIGFFKRFVGWSMDQGWLLESPLPKDFKGKKAAMITNDTKTGK